MEGRYCCSAGGIVTVLNVELKEAWLHKARAESDRVGHYSCTKNSTGKIDAVPFHDGRGGNIASEDLADTCVADLGELDAETDHHAENEGHDEEFKEAKAGQGPVWVIEHEENQDVDEALAHPRLL